MDRLKKAFKQVNEEVDIACSNSSQEARTGNRYSPRETAHMLIGRMVEMKKGEQDRKDLMGRWSSFQLEGNNKIIQMINMHRIPESTKPGTLKSRA